MSNFFSNIINRHNTPQNLVLPRRKSLFEVQHDSSDQFPSEKITEIPSSNTSLSGKFAETPTSIIEEKIKAFPRNDNTGKNDSNEKSNMVINKKNSITEKFQLISDRVANIHKRNFSNNKMIAPQNSFIKKNKPLIAKTEPSIPNQIEKKNPFQTLNPSNTFVNKRKSRSGREASTMNHPTSIAIEETLINSNSKQFFNTVQNHLQLSNRFENHSKVNSKKETEKTNTSTIKIHIGRIDIKAITQKTSQRKKVSKSNPQGMSLEQFLKKRQTKS